eukprot:IDg9567t1
MGPEGAVASVSAFADKTPPAYDGHTDYTSYRQDVGLWLHLTSLSATKRGPALIGRLSGEPKASAKTLSIEKIIAEDGVNSILEHLDKSYAIDKTDQLDLDLAGFLDFSRNGRKSVEQFIAGFHARLDRIADLQIDEKLKGHLLLRQAYLDSHTRNMIVGAAGGKYEVSHISSALRQAYRTTQKPQTMTTQPGDNSGYENRSNNANRSNKRYSTSKHPRQPTNHSTQTFLSTYSSKKEKKCRAIVDTGACVSVVGKETLDRAMSDLSIQKMENDKPSQGSHRFGDSK